MKYGKPIGSRFSFGPIYFYISKEIADCYMFIVIDVLRCFRILTSGFTSWLHDVLHCLVFKEHPRFPRSVSPALSRISFYILPHPVSLVKKFFFFLSDPRCGAFGAFCRRLVIYYSVRCPLSILFSLPRQKSFRRSAIFRQQETPAVGVRSARLAFLRGGLWRRIKLSSGFPSRGSSCCAA